MRTRARDKPVRNLRIIVADDDKRMREFYGEVLSRMGHEVVGSAADGTELVEICLSTEADLVVTDIRMPGMDGIAAAHIVTERVELPFLFVSAYHDDSLVNEASLAFSYGYLVKPIKQEDLATTIPIAVRRFWER
jgi:response regulator NasT